MKSELTAKDLDVFYPIVPDIGWLERLVPLGVRTIQLRIKDQPEAEVRRQIAAALAVTRPYRCQLIVNDYWREAIDAGADYIHLGQEDLATAALQEIRSAGIKLGVSTHTPEELEIALAAKPDYVALGPIWETKLKPMAFAPQGLERIGLWKQRIGDLPLIAIGGITPERADSVVSSGAQSVAVITDFFIHPDPEARVATWLDWARRYRD